MTRTSLFKSNQTQAVRLPKDVAFPADVVEVDIVVVGDSRIITPAGHGWDHWFEHGLPVTDDFMASRDQPEMQQRADF